MMTKSTTQEQSLTYVETTLYDFQTGDPEWRLCGFVNHDELVAFKVLDAENSEPISWSMDPRIVPSWKRALLNQNGLRHHRI